MQRNCGDKLTHSLKGGYTGGNVFSYFIDMAGHGKGFVGKYSQGLWGQIDSLALGLLYRRQRF